jgi:hypothetical protein
MNFPESQRIGSLAEQDVMRLFTSWGWGAGQDQIDAGYDLTVEPDRRRYKGARFLVQVKGTARGKRGSIIAPVSKKRLREYLDNPHPVLIVRAFADGTLYWVHAQHWARANRHKLEGDGKSGVKLEKTHDLANRNLLEAFLDEALKPLSHRAGSISNLAQERSNFLSSIDPRLGVKVSGSNDQEHYEIFAISEVVDSSFQFRPAQDPENIKQVRDIFGFGLPGTIAVESFRLEGSPLFDEIGASGKHSGKLSIQPTKGTKGFVHMFGGPKSTPFAPSLSIPAELFRGHQGAAVKSVQPSVFNLDIRLTVEPEGGRAEVKLGMRDEIYSLPIKQFGELACAPAWAERALEDQAMVVELSFHGVQMRLPVSGEGLQPMEAFLSFAIMLGRLHLVARATASGFTLRKDAAFDESDYSDINLAYSLLKGERRDVNVGPLELELNSGFIPKPNGEFLVTTTVIFSLGGQVLCSIPVRIELPGYKLECVPGTARHQLVRGTDGQAWATFAEGETFDGEVRSE